MNSIISVRVDCVEQQGLDILSFRLISTDGEPLPAFAPGSHIDVHLRSGLLRQYSLCGDPADCSHYVIAVKREPKSRGGSLAMHEAVRQGDVLTIGAPRNTFALAPDAQETLLVAGGIGVTPMISMALHLKAQDAPFQLHYFTRSIEHTAFHDLLSAPALSERVHFHYALGPEAVRQSLHRVLCHRAKGGHLYICGPRPFMDLVTATAAPSWPSEAVHLEHFAADPLALALAASGSAFEVVLARTGGGYRIPEGRSIVEVLAEHGVAVELSCEQGICGTCLTGVIEGVPDHRDMYLTDGEKASNSKMTVCVSRARSPTLVLDL